MYSLQTKHFCNPIVHSFQPKLVKDDTIQYDPNGQINNNDKQVDMSLDFLEMEREKLVEKGKW